MTSSVLIVSLYDQVCVNRDYLWPIMLSMWVDVAWLWPAITNTLSTIFSVPKVMNDNQICYLLFYKCILHNERYLKIFPLKSRNQLHVPSKN